MAIKVPPSSSPPGFRPSSGPRHVHRRAVGPKIGAGNLFNDAPPDEPHEPPLPKVAKKVQALNRKASSEWTSDDYRELERLAEMLLADAENQAKQHFTDNPFARQQSIEAAKLQLRMLLQSLEPPAELLELFTKLWLRAQSLDPNDLSTYLKKSIMTSGTRRDVMNRQVEEAVDEADRHATEKRVEAIERDAGQGGQQRHEGDEAPPDKKQSFKQTLKVLRKKRREIAHADVIDAADKALDTMRTLRELVAPRWAPETQPWLLNTADTHVYQTLLAVVPEQLLKETNAYQGIQNLRAGQHAFSSRASGKLEEGAQRS